MTHTSEFEAYVSDLEQWNGNWLRFLMEERAEVAEAEVQECGLMDFVELMDFVGNPDLYAVQQGDGSYQGPVRAPITRNLLTKHLAGDITLGTYTVRYDKARYFVFDVDSRDLALARSLAAEATARGFFPGIEFSGKKGYHIWVLLSGWEPAGDVQRLAKSIAKTVGFTGEVYPKQAVARDTGSLIKLPLGVHQETGNSSKFLTVPGFSTAEGFMKALSALPLEASLVTAPANKDFFPCLGSIQDDPPKPGERNNLTFHYAAMLRRQGLHTAALRAVLEDLNASIGLSQVELDGIISNSEFSGPICDQLPDSRRCGETCIKARSTGALSLRPGQLRHATDGELVVVQVGKHGAVPNLLELEHPDFTTGLARLKSTD